MRGEGQQRAVVLDGVMSAAHDSVPVTTAIPDQDHGHTVQTDVVANLLECARIEKWRNTVHPRTQSCLSETSRHGNHVLLGYAGIDKALTHLIAKWLERLKSEIAGEKHESRIGELILGERCRMLGA